MATKAAASTAKHEPQSPYTIWLYIDRLDHTDKKVWGVHWRNARGQVFYRRVAHVRIYPGQWGARARFFGAQHTQPKAVVEFHGTVKLSYGHHAQIRMR